MCQSLARGHLAFAAFVILLSGAPAFAQQGGGPSAEDAAPRATPCVSDEEWFAATAIADTNRSRFGLDSTTRSFTGPPAFDFFPMAGIPNRDIFISNFVDLDPTAGLLDFDCLDRTYNGHDASDTGLRSFGEQWVGVPIFAALEGTVTAAHDGEFDENTCFLSECGHVTANHVIVDHGGGLRTYYWHMKNGSVAVSVGQQVAAGQQIGLVASSGISTGPHLHFATYLNGLLIEPFEGACGSNETYWTQQIATPTERYISDAAVTYESLAPYSFTDRLPRSGQIATSDASTSFWIRVHNQAPNLSWRVQFRRPDDSIAFDSGLGFFPNDEFYRSSWWWWSYSVSDMQAITGTWDILLFIGGALELTLPVDVVTQRDLANNRAPLPLSAIFEPSGPTAFDVVFCVIDHDLVHDDPDYDLIEYTYEWRVDGNLIRRVTSAAHSDAIPKGTFAGSLLECTITPSDGVLNGPTFTVSYSATLEDVYVDFNASSGGDGTLANPFNDFHAGVDAVESGGNVHIFPGSGAFAGAIGKPVTVINHDAPAGPVILAAP